jgi:hypothetical protein
VSRAIETLSRVTDGYFRDPTTGSVLLVEKPNAKFKAVGLLLAAPHALRKVHVVSAGDSVEVFFERAAMAMLLWWSVDEVLNGTTKYLKTTAAVALVGAVMRTVLVERGRWLARPQPRL